MKYFNVSFRTGSVYCANIAHAENAADVRAHYIDKDEIVAISLASDGEVKTAQRKGMPVIKCSHIDDVQLHLAQEVKDLSGEQIAIFTRFFQLLVSPETHDSVAAFADQIISGGIPATFAAVEDFCTAR